jgi:hypothetical protein
MGIDFLPSEPQHPDPEGIKSSQPLPILIHRSLGDFQEVGYFFHSKERGGHRTILLPGDNFYGLYIGHCVPFVNIKEIICPSL